MSIYVSKVTVVAEHHQRSTGMHVSTEVNIDVYTEYVDTCFYAQVYPRALWNVLVHLNDVYAHVNAG